MSVADPGVSVGGRRPVGAGTDLRCIRFSAKKYAKMKELDLVGRVWPGHPLDPPMDVFMISIFAHDTGISWSNPCSGEVPTSDDGRFLAKCL